MKVTVLGAAGSRCGVYSATCLQIDTHLLIDAGHLGALPVEQWQSIEVVLLTHAHFDHIADLPFLLGCTWQQRQVPLRIYGHPATLQAVQQHLFNDTIWTDFRNLRLPNGQDPVVQFEAVEAGQLLRIGSYYVIPFRSNHPVPTLGYVVKQGDRGFAFTSDTGPNPQVWEMVNADAQIKAVITEVSLPNRLSAEAAAVGHYTPQLLREDLRIVRRTDVTIYAVHWKPELEAEVLHDIATDLPDVVVLRGGEQLEF